MFNIISSNQFKRDLKMIIKRHLNTDALNCVVTILAKGEKLEEKYHDHPLSGNYAEFRECHIQPDWLLIYRIDGDDLILFLSRTGTHSDLF